MERPNPFADPASTVRTVAFFEELPPTQDEIAKYAATRKLRAVKYYAIGFGCVALTGLCTWAIMAIIQPFFRPPTPPGGWVIDPPAAFTYFRALYTPAFVCPPMIGYLKRRWNRKEIRNGFAGLPTHNGPIPWTYHVFGWTFMGFLFLLLTLASLGFMRGYTVISPSGIHAPRLWNADDYQFSQIRSICQLRENERVGNTATHGPALRLTMANGRRLEFGHDNGLDQSQVSAILMFVSQQSGCRVSRYPDAQVR